MPTRAILLALPLILLLIIPGTASAATDDAVYVLSYGGVDSLQLLDLDERGGAAVAVNLGAEPIRAAADGPTTITDFKPLPDGGLLLTDVGGVGVVWVDKDRATSRVLYRAPEAPLFPLAAASVVSYDTSGMPRQLLLGDTTTSAAILYDVPEQRTIWAQSAFLPTGRGFVSQVVSQPDGRLWIGLWWRGIALTGVDRLLRDPTNTLPAAILRVANRAHEGAPTALSILDTLDEVRDVQGLPDGGALIAGRRVIVRLDAEGAPAWQLDLVDLPGVAGELSSARLLPSGKLAIATREPGEWTAPNLNHRVHWLTEPDAAGAATVLATSGPLNAAPRRIEPVVGGGTGTLGWAGPPAVEEPLELAALTLSPALSATPTALKPGQSLTLAAGLRNPGPGALPLDRASIKATRADDCAATTGLVSRTLSERRDVTLAPEQTLDIGGMLRIDEGWLPGSWCVFVEVSRTNAQRRLPQTVKITVSPLSPPVRVDQLDFVRYDLDMDVPDLGMEPAPPISVPGDDEGCGCMIPAQHAAPQLAWALLILPLLGYRRR